MLSVTAEHALRALTEMARFDDGRTILGRQLAEIAEIPANYLSKILWALGNAGIIDATRGNHGGYRLRRNPNQIRLIEVVELFDRPKRNEYCFLSSKRECSGAESCTAHARWRDVRMIYEGFLESTTIAELAGMADEQQTKGRKKAASGKMRI